jgi:hypothetical protein
MIPVYDKKSFDELVLQPTLFWMGQIERLGKWIKKNILRKKDGTYQPAEPPLEERDSS